MAKDKKIEITIEEGLYLTLLSMASADDRKKRDLSNVIQGSLKKYLEKDDKVTEAFFEDLAAREKTRKKIEDIIDQVF